MPGFRWVDIQISDQVARDHSSADPTPKVKCHKSNIVGFKIKPRELKKNLIRWLEIVGSFNFLYLHSCRFRRKNPSFCKEKMRSWSYRVSNRAIDGHSSYEQESYLLLKETETLAFAIAARFSESIFCCGESKTLEFGTSIWERACVNLIVIL